MVFENGVKNMQATAYNGVCTVSENCCNGLPCGYIAAYSPQNSAKLSYSSEMTLTIG